MKHFLTINSYLLFPNQWLRQLVETMRLPSFQFWIWTIVALPASPLLLPILHFQLCVFAFPPYLFLSWTFFIVFQSHVCCKSGGPYTLSLSGGFPEMHFLSKQFAIFCDFLWVVCGFLNGIIPKHHVFAQNKADSHKDARTTPLKTQCRDSATTSELQRMLSRSDAYPGLSPSLFEHFAPKMWLPSWSSFADPFPT